MIRVRTEKSDDIRAIRELNDRAFGGPVEGEIVDRIRGACRETLSLVAEEKGLILAHVFFSPVTLPCLPDIRSGMGLAPMAVQPERQRQGIGSNLVREGLRRLEKEGCPYVVVLGHPGYYPRFGFEPASTHNLRSQWEGVPDEAFRILVLMPGALDGASGVVRYRPEFDDAV